MQHCPRRESSSKSIHSHHAIDGIDPASAVMDVHSAPRIALRGISLGTIIFVASGQRLINPESLPGLPLWGRLYVIKDMLEASIILSHGEKPMVHQLSICTMVRVPACRIHLSGNPGLSQLGLIWLFSGSLWPNPSMRGMTTTLKADIVFRRILQFPGQRVLPRVRYPEPVGFRTS